MKTHTKVYFNFYGYNEADHIPCEICLHHFDMFNVAVDIHHISPKGMGGKAGKDKIENLIALCRKCHEDCHKSVYTKEYLFGINSIKRSSKG